MILLMEGFESLLWYPVILEKFIDLEMKYGIDTWKYLDLLDLFDKEYNCPMGMSVVWDEYINIIIIYKGPIEEKVDIPSVLKKYPPFLNKIKEDLGIIGDPQLYKGVI